MALENTTPSTLPKGSARHFMNTKSRRRVRRARLQRDLARALRIADRVWNSLLLSMVGSVLFGGLVIASACFAEAAFTTAWALCTEWMVLSAASYGFQLALSPKIFSSPPVLAKTDASKDPTILISIIGPLARAISLRVTSDYTVGGVLNKLRKQRRIPDLQRVRHTVLYNGVDLNDLDMTLHDAGIANLSVLQVRVSVLGGARATASTGESSSSGSANKSRKGKDDEDPPPRAKRPRAGPSSDEEPQEAANDCWREAVAQDLAAHSAYNAVDKRLMAWMDSHYEEIPAGIHEKLLGISRWVANCICRAPLDLPHYTQDPAASENPSGYPHIRRSHDWRSRSGPQVMEEADENNIQYLWKTVALMMHLSPRFCDELVRAASDGTSMYIDISKVFLDNVYRYNGPGIYTITVTLVVKLRRLLHFYVGSSEETQKRINSHLRRFRDSEDGRGNKVNKLVAQTWRQEPDRKKHSGYHILRLPKDTPDPVKYFMESLLIRLSGATIQTQGGLNVNALDRYSGKRDDAQVDDLTIIAIYKAAVARQEVGALPSKGSHGWTTLGAFRDINGELLGNNPIRGICLKTSYRAFTSNFAPLVQFVDEVPRDQMWTPPRPWRPTVRGPAIHPPPPSARSAKPRGPEP
ncbi:hypothetical protein B0H14DRAFT_3055212 [Mycena olivaceomarginata]|nr:hypothetical protein B0H14DRAFT_3055212 [Mycena olivaceomarginata]